MAKGKKICGIYKIENLVNGKVYIGQSVDIKARWSCHKSEFNKNIHSGVHFQRAWNKYGASNFKLTIIEECEEPLLNEKEIFYIELYQSNNPEYGYNCESGGREGKKINEELKKYLSKKIREYFDKTEIVPTAKLKKEEVIMIKKLLFDGEMTLKEIADMFNINSTNVVKIRDGKTYTKIKTPYDNMILGKISKKGEKYGKKLTKEQVVEIKKLLTEGNYTQVEIANMYNVKRKVIVDIKTLKKWINVGKEYNELLKNMDYKNGSNNYNSLINEQIVRDIKEKLFNKISATDIANEYNISIGLVQDIKKGRAWKHVITTYDEEIKNIKSNKCDNKNCKFNEEQIVLVKKMFVEEDKTIMEIAKELNCGRNTISDILHNKINMYKKIHTPYDEKVVEKIKKVKFKLTDEDVKEIKKLINEGYTNKKISEIYNIDPSCISNIRNNKAWKHITV